MNNFTPSYQTKTARDGPCLNWISRAEYFCRLICQWPLLMLIIGHEKTLYYPLMSSWFGPSFSSFCRVYFYCYLLWWCLEREFFLFLSTFLAIDSLISISIYELCCVRPAQFISTEPNSSKYCISLIIKTWQYYNNNFFYITSTDEGEEIECCCEVICLNHRNYVPYPLLSMIKRLLRIFILSTPPLNVNILYRRLSLFYILYLDTISIDLSISNGSFGYFIDQ